MDYDPVSTLKRPYKAQRPVLLASGGQGSDGSGNSKRQRLSELGSTSTSVYRDGETTGYEDDGSEQLLPWQGVGKHQPVKLMSAALSSLTNISKPAPYFPLTVNNKANDPNVRSINDTRLCYQVMWRKPQSRKNKTWDGDGILCLNGDIAQLKEKESGRVLSTGKIPERRCWNGQVLAVGTKEVEIDSEIPYEDYTAGACFSTKYTAPSIAPDTDPDLSRAPLASSINNFYGPKKSMPGFVPPTMTKSAYASTRVGMPLPSKTVDVATPPKRHETVLPPSAKLATSARTNVATAGFRKDKVPTSFYTLTEDSVVMPRPSAAHQQIYNKKNYPIVDVVIDPIMGKKLRAHQVQGVKFLYECVMGMRTEGCGAILADEMGLGKTCQSIALIHTLLRQTPYFGGTPIIQRAVIVCPVTLVQNWAKEFVKWLGPDRLKVFRADGKNDLGQFLRGRHYPVMIIGYERLRNVVDQLKSCQPPIGLIICDEGHRLKSAGAKTTLALQSLKTQRRIILSGTPIQNDLSEFHAMADFVNPGLLDSYQTFKKTFEQPILRSREQNCPPDAKELGEHRAEALHRHTATFILRRTSDVIAGYLPPKSEYVVFVAPSELQKKIYNYVFTSRQLRSTIANGRSPLSLLTLIRKVCNSPGLLMPQARNEDAATASDELLDEIVALIPDGTRHTDPQISGKLQSVENLLRTLRDGNEEKCVLVSNFTKSLDLLQAMCNKNRWKYCRLDGSTKTSDRQAIVDRFNRAFPDDQFVFLLSAKSGGTGLNIIGASRLILFDGDWNPSTDLQAMARIHRDGQRRPCFIYRYLTTGTIDEKIFQRQITKMDLAGSMMDGAAGKSGGGGKEDTFSAAELRDIFTIKDSTACQTHELLGCDCNPSTISMETENPNEDFQDPLDTDEELPDIRTGIIKASQYSKTEEANTARAQKKLAKLKEWTHVNTERDKEAALENIEDDVLLATVRNGMDELNRAMARLFQVDHSDDEDDPTSDEIAARRRLYKGGEVTFVFHKTSSTMPPAAT